jgi:hypothetical protein
LGYAESINAKPLKIVMHPMWLSKLFEIAPPFAVNFSPSMMTLSGIEVHKDADIEGVEIHLE